MIQLAGFGLATWSKRTLSEDYPFIYKGMKPPFYDRNLGSLCERHETNVLLCHIRASGYDSLNYEAVVNENNCHPFIFLGFRLAVGCWLVDHFNFHKRRSAKSLLVYHYHNQIMSINSI